MSVQPILGRGSVTLTCPVCKNSFRRNPGSASRAVTCSRTCKWNAYKLRLITSRPKTRNGVAVQPWTEAELEFLRANYRREGAKQCGVKLGRAAQTVAQQARKLGLNRHKTRPWTADERQFLRQNETRSVSWLMAQLGRSRESIQYASRELGISARRKAVDWWSTGEVAAIFGVHPEAVAGWVDRGLLYGLRVAARWRITPAAVHRFIHDHPTRFNIGKVDQISFIDVCKGEGLAKSEKGRNRTAGDE